MRALSKAKINRIIDLLFSGNSFRKTAGEMGVSTSSAHKYLEEFIGAAEEVSIEKAAAKYNIQDTVDHLLELAQEARKTKVSVPNLLSATRLYRFMKARDLKPSQLKSFLKMCDKYQHVFADFASKATEFYQLEERTGKTYEELPKELSIMAKRRTTLKEEISKLRGEITKLKKKKKHDRDDLEQELKINNLVRKEIPYASALKKTLSEYEYTVEETSKIPKFLKEIQVCRGNAKVFLERTAEAKNLKWEILDLKDEKKSLEPVVESLKKEGLEFREARDQLRGEIVSLKATKQELQEENKRLDAEANRKSNKLRLTHCLTSILKSKLTDVDALYNYAYWLKQIASGKAPESLSRKPHYEEAVRKIIADVLLEYLHEELAPKEEVTRLEKELGDVRKQVSSFSTENISLRSENEKLSKDKGKLEKQVEWLEKELEECSQRLLQEPTAHAPKDTKLPF
ncbi:MAG: hypothetical protein OEW62_01780 [Candidatus Bathyarchaeota archaeon]|nr:hypothetical protein [Candidatus Bathyarchaeota archaeon]MDH5595176.1 hypothetical protein [Candidatus Bathyarchaeota archaeon]